MNVETNIQKIVGKFTGLQKILQRKCYCKCNAHIRYSKYSKYLPITLTIIARPAKIMVILNTLLVFTHPATNAVCTKKAI